MKTATDSPRFKSLSCRFFMALMVIALLSACSNIGQSDAEPTVMRLFDFDLSQRGCAMPCWSGIEIGKTNLADLKTILNAKGGPYSEMEFDNRFTIPYHDQNSSETFVVENNKVSLIEITIPSYSSVSLTLANLIDELGEPCCTLLAYGHDNHEASATLTLYYPDKGFIATTNLQSVEIQEESIKICIENMDEVFGVRLRPPSDLEAQILYFNFLGNPDTPQEYIDNILSFIKPWPGFDCLDVPYSPHSPDTILPVLQYR